MSELPTNWADIALSEIAQVTSGIGFPNEYQGHTSGDLPFFKVSDISYAVLANRGELKTANHYVSHEVAEKLKGKPLVPGSTVFAKIGEAVRLNRRATVVAPCLIDNNVMAVKAREGVNDRYVHQFLRTVDFGESARSTTVPSLRKGDVEELRFPLAPVAEQKRIADKLDTVLTRVDAVNTRLARVAPLLKRFRQSVLAAATSGRLTEDWRYTNPGTPEQAQVELSAVRSKHLGKLKVRGEAARVDDEKLFPIPPSWAWTLNHHLAKDDSNAICAGPFGTIFKAKDFRDSGVPIIFLRHVGEGRYMTHKPGFMDVNVWREHHQPYSVSGGELLVTKLGDPPGTACIYPNGIGAAMVTPDVLKMEVNEEAADTTYLMHFFNSPNSKQIIEELCFGVTRLRIDIAMFKTFPIPLPPRAEQTEIVRRVETLFAFADRLEARLAQAQTAATRLTPALLAKAFRGELVPQDPNDEPAAELLRRLAQAPAAASPRKGRKPASAAA